MNPLPTVDSSQGSAPSSHPRPHAGPDLSVIVVTHNGRDMALATLRSARAGLGPLSAEWLVVDSGSTDGTADAIEREWDDVLVRRCANRGFAAGNNVALRQARGRYVLLLNPDVEIERGTLAELVAAMDARPAVGVASVVHHTPGGEPMASIRRFPSPGRDLGEALFAWHWPLLHTLQEPDVRFERYGTEQSADWLVGAFLIARREAVEVVGPMDERFFLYCEEVDWCYRFRATGWDVRHLPVMSITHHAGRRDTGDLIGQLAHSRVLFADKHYGVLKRLGVRLALALGHVVRLTLLAPAAVVRPSLRARLRCHAQALVVTLGAAEPPLRSG